MSQFTAKVSRGQIVIRDVDIPEGTIVTVHVRPSRFVETPWGWVAPEVVEDFRVSLRSLTPMPRWRSIRSLAFVVARVAA